MANDILFGEFKALTYKIKIYHIVAVFVLSALLLSLSVFSFCSSLSKKENCTATVYGTVSYIRVDRQNKWRYQNGKKERYTETTMTTYISVETDGVFTKDTIITSKKMKTGDKVVINYDPDNPNTYYLNNDTGEFIFLPMIGIFLLLVGLAMTLLYRINKREQNSFYY